MSGTVLYGVHANNYLHWNLTTDGGSADTNATLHLGTTVGGNELGDYATSKDSGGAFHFYTPYFTPDPSTLHAYVGFDVLTTGNGSWNLVISHGCPGGTTPPASDLIVTKTALPSFKRTFKWTIDKSADTDTVYSAGGGESGAVKFTVAVTKDTGTDSDFAISGKITVANPNDDDVTGVDVSDATPGGTCAVTGGDDVTVPANGSVELSYTCTFATNPGSGTNTATATWPDIGSEHTSGTGTADYTFDDPTTVVNDEINVTDTNGKSWKFTASGSESYTETYTDPKGTCTEHKNTATITETGLDSSVTVKDCQGVDLTVSKTATPAFDRKYGWTIVKAVNKTYVEQVGGTATFNYTVTVSHDAGTASGWTVTGKITISNPNDWQDITLTDLSDSIDNGGSCVVDAGPYVVPKSGSIDVGYTCAYSSAPSRRRIQEHRHGDLGCCRGTHPERLSVGRQSGAFGAPTTTTDECVERFRFVQGRARNRLCRRPEPEAVHLLADGASSGSRIVCVLRQHGNVHDERHQDPRLRFEDGDDLRLQRSADDRLLEDAHAGVRQRRRRPGPTGARRTARSPPSSSQDRWAVMRSTPSRRHSRSSMATTAATPQPARRTRSRALRPSCSGQS